LALPPHPSRVAFVTFAARSAITADDQLLADALSSHGVQVDAQPWDGDVAWDVYDRIVLRSCWNFHTQPRAFLDWVARIGSEHPGALRNAPALVRWCVDKHYLDTLAGRGISIVPTEWVAATINLAALLTARGWRTGAVVKPAVSATANETWRVEMESAVALQPRFERLLAASPSGVMVQPFLPEIQSGGEWSLIFLGGEFSHAIVKRAAPGDFRVQKDFGGTHATRVPSATIIADAAAALREAAAATGLLPRDVLYVRVDGIERAGRLVLMELEAIEPILYFSEDPSAAERMAALV
jgi:glutathione synthase/RimK-type ligase-like ATP-grasp enzyme